MCRTKRDIDGRTHFETGENNLNSKRNCSPASFRRYRQSESPFPGARPISRARRAPIRARSQITPSPRRICSPLAGRLDWSNLASGRYASSRLGNPRFRKVLNTLPVAAIAPTRPTSLSAARRSPRRSIQLGRRLVPPENVCASSENLARRNRIL